MLFLTSGVVYGRITGVIRSDRDVVRLASESMAAMSPYIVLAFAAAHFIAMFTWSNLGVIIAIHGADALRASGLPIPILMMAIVLLTAGLDMLIGSASAKWAALAPVLVPMLMLLGISPEMTTAAYRMGDSTVNMASPLMPYFGLVLGFCQRWRPGFGVERADQRHAALLRRPDGRRASDDGNLDRPGIAARTRLDGALFGSGDEGRLTRFQGEPIKRASRFARPYAGVAQLVRAPACHAGGRGFEPRHSRHFFHKNWPCRSRSFRERPRLPRSHSAVTLTDHLREAPFCHFPLPYRPLSP